MGIPRTLCCSWDVHSEPELTESCLGQISQVMSDDSSRHTCCPGSCGHSLNRSEVGDPSGKAGLDAFAFLAFSNPV